MTLSNNKATMKIDYVIKRNGDREAISFDKVMSRIRNLSNDLNINITKITQDICSQIYPDVPTYKLDELGAQIAVALSTEHPDNAI